MWSRRSVLVSGIAVTLGAILPTVPARAATGQARIGMASEPPHLDPTAGEEAGIAAVAYGNIFEGLTRIDDNDLVQPALAQSWTISEDGLTYQFSLQQDVRFHDGSAFDAGHVVFSFTRLADPQSQNPKRALFEPIASVTAVDAANVRFSLKRPSADFLYNIGRPAAVIVAPESADNNQQSPIGTGPFAFVDWTKGSRILFERNEDYWGPHPKLTQVTLIFVADPATAISALIANDLDGFPHFPAPELLEPFKAKEDFRLVVGTTESETLLVANNGKAPFNDLRVRQAIAHCIDRKAIIDGAMSGYGIPIGSHFSPLDAGYLDLAGTYPYDLGAAKKLLAEAGFPDGFATTLKLPPPGYARRGGPIMAAQLAAIGIKATLINVEWEQWLKEVFAGKDYDLTLISQIEPLDIGIYADPNYYFGYADQQFQALMARINVTTDAVARKDLLEAAQKRLAEQAVNGYLFELAEIGVWKARLAGMWANAPIEACPLGGLYWEQ